MVDLLVPDLETGVLAVALHQAEQPPAEVKPQFRSDQASQLCPAPGERAEIIVVDDNVGGRHCPQSNPPAAAGLVCRATGRGRFTVSSVLFCRVPWCGQIDRSEARFETPDVLLQA